MTNPKPKSGVLVLIGTFKLLKAALLVVVGLGLHHMLNHDAEQFLRECVHAVRIDPENRYIHAGIEKMTGLSPRTLREWSVGTFTYAVLFIVEGTGLVLGARWAEYLTVVSTTGLLPVEVYELIHRPRAGKVVILVLNLVIAVYLIARLYRDHKRETIGRDHLGGISGEKRM
jgi:uncharacterized membrane protein (DUF2068 family)